MDQITVNASVDQVKAVTRFVNDHLDAPGCSVRARVQVNVAIDEIFSNIARYAYTSGTGPVTVGIEVKGDPQCAIIQFIDRGRPYDPLAAEIPDITRLPKEERPVGGLGLFMVKKITDDISYEYKDGQNILTIRKRI